jgi:AmmeMemoRadiSam system protein B/AmmeMemoRadiSam system protein A
MRPQDSGCVGRRVINTLSAAAIAVLAASTVSARAPAAEPGGVREAAVAGAFYPSDPDALASMVDAMLADASAAPVDGKLIALICPHAGYEYSGRVAAESYAQLRGADVRRVVVIAPSHVEAFDGVAVYNGTGYATPLGVVRVDTDFAASLAAASPSIRLSGRGHDYHRGSRGEHAVEVQIPFLQRVLGKDFRIVPIVMGDQSYEICRALGVALAKTIGDDPRTVLIASSDLSHFHDYDEARRLDRMVLKSVEAYDYYSLSRNFATRNWEACGGGPIVAVMMASERLGADKAVLLKYANSGDVPGGDRNRVVGYSAFALVDAPEGRGGGGGFTLKLTAPEKRRLLEISKASVTSAVRDGKIMELDDGGTETLLAPLGAFVTLEEDGQLRGCIGYVAPTKPLQETVRDVAAFAAVRDRRFDPVSVEELPRLEYEVSVLSPLRRVTDVDQIRVGTHGLLIKRGGVEGLLLPQVASEWGWDRTTFLERTCAKAGLPLDAWKDDGTDIFMFSALVFGEHENP